MSEIAGVKDESPSASTNKAKDEYDSLDEAEAKDTLDNSDVKNGEASKSAPRVGFKHDPHEERALANMELDIPARSKKKKTKRRPKSKRGENAPTGFEPFYADAPITPREYQKTRG
ncbi:Argonaute complex subunit Arb1 [Penicillium sp. DV-2018c]|nr:Argonaute complex subunit Arb1 [Penicillium sp. DV-2018c]